MRDRKNKKLIREEKAKRRSKTNVVEVGVIAFKGEEKRLLNRRVLLFAAFAFAVGQFAAALLYRSVMLSLFFAGAMLLFGIVCLCVKSLRKIPVLILLAGFMLSFSSLQIHTVAALDADVVAEGRICAYEKISEEQNRYLLSDLFLNGTRAEANAYLVTDKLFTLGDIVRVEGRATSVSIDPLDSVSMSRYHDDAHYSLEGTASKIRDGKRTVFERMREKLIVTYREVMGEEGAIATALFLGDSAFIDTADNEAYRITGIRHAFAVSGLHVGFLGAVLMFAVKKLRLPRKPGEIAICVAIFLYAGLTGFHTGTLRAAFIVLLVTLAGFFSRRPDSLNNLATAYLCTQMIYPLSVFEIGTQMSFLAVLGIVFFYPVLKNKAADKSSFVRALWNPLVLSLSANAFLLPLFFTTFSEFGVLFALSNLIVLPLITLSFFVLAPVSILIWIYQGFAIFLVPVQWILRAVNFIVASLAQIAPAQISQGNALAASLLLSLVLCFQAPHLLIEKETRNKACIGGVLLSALMIAIT